MNPNTGENSEIKRYTREELFAINPDEETLPEAEELRQLDAGRGNIPLKTPKQNNNDGKRSSK